MELRYEIYLGLRKKNRLPLKFSTVGRSKLRSHHHLETVKPNLTNQPPSIEPHIV